MTSPFAAAVPPRRCRQCQAPLVDEVKTCWMCGGDTTSAAPVTSTAVMSENLPASAQPAAKAWYLHGAIWLGIVVAATVGFGVINLEDSGLAWLYFFTVGPALLFTIAGAAVGRYTDKPWHPLKKILVFIAAVSVSFLLTAVIAILLLLAAIVAFLQWCFGGMPA